MKNVLFGLVGLASAATAHADQCTTTSRYACKRYATTDISRGVKMSTPAKDNLVFIPKGATASRKMLVFLPGTGGSPDGYENFLADAADHGYIVVGLMFQNTSHSPDLCGWFPSCIGGLYNQNVMGNNNGFYAKAKDDDGVTPYHNSINYRFKGILEKLKVDVPSIDWDAYWDTGAAYRTNGGGAMSGEPMWSKIIIAGHSQGGETATWITKTKPVLGGLTFEAPYATLNDCHACDNSADATHDGSPRQWTRSGGTWESVARSTANVTGWDQHLADNPLGTPFGRDDAFPSYLRSWHPTNLIITLDTHDAGYEGADLGGYAMANGPGSWAGHNMHGAGKLLLQRDPVPMSSAAPASVAAHFFALTAPPVCGGHQDTIVDDCAPAWIDAYYEKLFAEADTF